MIDLATEILWKKRFTLYTFTCSHHLFLLLLSWKLLPWNYFALKFCIFNCVFSSDLTLREDNYCQMSFRSDKIEKKRKNRKKGKKREREISFRKTIFWCHLRVFWLTMLALPWSGDNQDIRLKSVMMGCN